MSENQNIKNGELEFLDGKKAQWLKISLTDDVDVRKQKVNEVIQIIFKDWPKLYSPELIISVTGGAKDFDVPDELMTSLKNGLCKALSITNAWIISGGTDVGVMKLVGEVVASQKASNNLVVLGVVTSGIIVDREKLTFKYDNSKINNDKESAFLNPNHTHFIFVDEGKGKKFGQEIKFRTELESQLSVIKFGDNTKEQKVPIILLVINGGPNTLLTVDEAMQKNIPVLVIEGSKSCADLIASITKERIKQNEDERILELIDKSGVIGKFENKDEELRTRKEAFDRLKNIIKRYKKNKSLLNVFNIENSGNNNIEKEILRIFMKTQLEEYDTILIKTLAKEWGYKNFDDFFFEAFKENKPTLVEALLKNKDYKIEPENIFNKNKLLELYRTSSFYDELLNKLKIKKANNEIEYEHIKRSLKTLVFSRFEESIVPHEIDEDDEKVKNVQTNLFFWALLNNYAELAILLWNNTDHQIANALIASKILRTMATKLKSTDTKHSQDFENLAIDKLNNFDKKDLVPLVLMKNIECYNNECLLSIANFCECKKFMKTTETVQSTLKLLWSNGLTTGRDHLIKRMMKDGLSLLSFGLFAPVLNFKKIVLLNRSNENDNDDDENNEDEVKLIENNQNNTQKLPDMLDEAKKNFENKLRQNLAKNIPDDKNQKDGYLVRYIKYWHAPKTRFINSFVSFFLFLALFGYLFGFHMENFITDKIKHISYRKFVIFEYLLDIWIFALIIEKFNQFFSYDLIMKAHITYAWRINYKYLELKNNKEFCCCKGLFSYLIKVCCNYFKYTKNVLDTIGITLYVTGVIFKYFLIHESKNDWMTLAVKCIFGIDIVIWLIVLLYYIVLFVKINLTVEQSGTNKSWNSNPYQIVLTHATYPILPQPLNLIFDPIYSIYNSFTYTKQMLKTRRGKSVKGDVESPKRKPEIYEELIDVQDSLISNILERMIESRNINETNKKGGGSAMTLMELYINAQLKDIKKSDLK